MKYLPVLSYGWCALFNDVVLCLLCVMLPPNCGYREACLDKEPPIIELRPDVRSPTFFFRIQIHTVLPWMNNKICSFWVNLFPEKFMAFSQWYGCFKMCGGFALIRREREDTQTQEWLSGGRHFYIQIPIHRRHSACVPSQLGGKEVAGDCGQPRVVSTMKSAQAGWAGGATQSWIGSTGFGA